MKFIVNADDCGYSAHVDEHIRNAITLGRVSSTTVMANMADFEGAVKMYAELHDMASFGMHFNLTEGEPLLENQELLDYGFYKIENGNVVFNGKMFKHRYLPKRIRNGIGMELEAQLTKVLDSGIKVSHIDSHHHVHTAPFILPVVTGLAKQYGIKKIRRINNRGFRNIKAFQFLWMQYVRSLAHLSTTTHFYGFDEFLEIAKTHCFPSESVIELMCHPGGKYHPDEETLVLRVDLKKQFDADIINYNNL